MNEEIKNETADIGNISEEIIENTDSEDELREQLAARYDELTPKHITKDDRLRYRKDIEITEEFKDKRVILNLGL